MSSITQIEPKEANKEEIQKILKQNILKIFNQIKKGCSRKVCYNIYCFNNLLCKDSNYINKLF
jgi:hypothetical protein